MKKKILCLLIIALSLVVSSCDFYYQEGLNYIKEPELKDSRLNGKWTLSGLKSQNEEDSPIENLYFKDGLIYLSENIYSSRARYQYKSVDSRDYLLYKHRVGPEFLDLDQDNLNIINIYEADDFLKELILTDDGRIILKKNTDFLYFTRTDESIDEADVLEKINQARARKGSRERGQASGQIGLLLGLKQRDESTGEWDYRTVYINIEDENNISSMEKKDILLPRKDGFYNVSVKNQGPVDQLHISSLENKDYIRQYEGQGKKNILYIGNDYISLENSNKQGRKLRIYHIDYLNQDQYISLKDILDEKTYDRISYDIKKLDDRDISKGFDASNIGLRRRRGYWSLFSEVDTAYGHKTFNIRALTPKQIVNYDEMPLIWESIESQVPKALDAFISPNEDFIVTYEADSLAVYRIKEGKILRQEAYRLKISPGDRVVMSEWATDIYSKIWQEYFER